MPTTTTRPAWLIAAAGLLERVVWTFAQAFLAYSLARGTLDVDTAQAAALAGVTAALALVLALLTDWRLPDLPPSVEALVRVARTYVVAVLTLVLANADRGPVDLSLVGWQAAAIAALPALLTAVKALAALRLAAIGVGAPSSATLPASLDPASSSSSSS